jgi:chromosome segregation ATPase
LLNNFFFSFINDRLIKQQEETLRNKEQLQIEKEEIKKTLQHYENENNNLRSEKIRIMSRLQEKEEEISNLEILLEKNQSRISDQYSEISQISEQYSNIKIQLETISKDFKQKEEELRRYFFLKFIYFNNIF